MRDFFYGLRMLRKRPGFTVLTVLTLALGIGATSAVFTLVEGVLLTPPPYRDPERLVLLSSVHRDGETGGRARDWSATQWRGWQEHAESFETIAAYRFMFGYRVLDEGSEPIEGMWVTPDYFEIVGLEPVLGRTLLESDLQEGADAVVVIGFDLWQRAFDGAEDVIGQTIRISRRAVTPTIVGVMPPGIRFLPSPSMAQEPNYDVDGLVDYWTPVILDEDWLDRPIWSVVGRLASEVTLEEAQAELEVLTTRQAAVDPELGEMQPRLQALVSQANREGRRILLPLFGAAALVLLISCGNAATLMLVGGLARRQEYGVRSAMGARRFAVFRQVIFESLLVAVLGAGLGMLLAVAVVRLFERIGHEAIPRLDGVVVGWPVLVSGLVAAVLAALGAGVWPALRATRVDPIQVLKIGGPKSSGGRADRRLLGAVSIAQTALTLALLVGAGLLIRTMVHLASVETGYDTSRVLTMSVAAFESDWDDFHSVALERVGSLPGVTSAAFAWGVPLTGNNWPGRVHVEGHDAEEDGFALPLRSVTPGYFELLGMAVAQGRDFRSTDRQGEPGVAVINRAMADRYFGGVDPLGKRLWLRGREGESVRVVGVVANGRTDDLARQAAAEIYLPLFQWGAFSKHLVVRTEGDPRSVVAAVQRELRTVEPTVAVSDVKTLGELRSESQASRAFATRLLVGFAVVATLLTLAGIFGVRSLSVAARGREIAIRGAIGAGRRDLLGLILKEGMRSILVGVGAGVLAAFALSRALGSFLFGVAPGDPLTLAVVGLLFTGLALLACWWPARRAARVDPVRVLRGD